MEIEIKNTNDKGKKMNTVIILGTLTKDVELKYLQSGNAAGNFSIAYNKKYKGQDGQLVEKVSFFDVGCFGKMAETINQFFHKGSRILIEGELEQQTWKAQDGTNRSKIIIRLDKFSFIDKKEQQDGGQQRGYSSNGMNNPPRNDQSQQMSQGSHDADVYY